MSYTLGPRQPLGITTYRTAPDGTLTLDERSWWDRNKNWVLLGGAAVGAIGLIGLLQYGRYRLWKSGPTGQAAAVGLIVAGA